MIKSTYFEVPYTYKNMTIALGSITLMFAIVIFSNKNFNKSFCDYVDGLFSNIEYEGFC